MKDKEILRKEWYTRVYTTPPSISIEVCIYCGNSFTECDACTGDNRVLIEFVEQLDSDDFQTIIDIFIEWATASVSERKQLIDSNVVQYPHNSGIGYTYRTIPNIGNAENLLDTIHFEIYNNKPIPLHIQKFIEKFILPSPLVYSQFSNWADSDNPVQRIIYYIIAFRAFNMHIADLPYQRIIEDIEVFSEMEYLRLVCEIPTKETFLKVIEKVSTDIQLISHLTPFHMILIFLGPCPTYKVSASVLSNLIRNYYTRPLNVPEFQAFVEQVVLTHLFKEDGSLATFESDSGSQQTETDSTTGVDVKFDDYKEIINFCFCKLVKNQTDAEKYQKILVGWYTGLYKEEFRKYIEMLLIDHLQTVLDYMPTDMTVATTCFTIRAATGILILQNQKKIQLAFDAETQSKIDRYILHLLMNIPGYNRMKIVDLFQEPDRYLNIISTLNFNSNDRRSYLMYIFSKRLKNRGSVESFYKLPDNAYFNNSYQLVARANVIGCRVSSFSETLSLWCQNVESLSPSFLTPRKKYSQDFVVMDELIQILKDCKKGEIVESKCFLTLVMDLFYMYLSVTSKENLNLDIISKYQDLFKHGTLTLYRSNKYDYYLIHIEVFKVFFGDDIPVNMIDAPKNKELLYNIYKEMFDMVFATTISSLRLMNAVTVFPPHKDQNNSILYHLNQFNTLTTAELFKVFKRICSFEDDLLGYMVINKFQSNIALLKMLLESEEGVLYEPSLNANGALERFVEISLKLKLVDQEQVPDIIDIIRKDYKSVSLDNLYSDVNLCDASDIEALISLINTYPFCYRSKRFMQFYSRIPDHLKREIRQTNSSYTIEMEHRKLMNITTVAMDPVSIPLPNILLEKIIHFIYRDKTIHYRQKVDIALVSKLFFEMCSNILTNHYWSASLDQGFNLNYMDVQYITLIHLDKPWSLWKNYPKLLNYEFSQDIEYNKIDHLFYDHFECISMIFDHQNTVFSPRRHTNLRALEIDVNISFRVADIIQLVKFSPLMEKMDMSVTIDWQEFEQFLEGIILPQHPHFKQFSVYFDSCIKDLGEEHQYFSCNINNVRNRVIQKLTSTSTPPSTPIRFPRISLVSVPEYIAFEGADSYNIKFVEPLVRDQLMQFYQPIFTKLTQIMLSLETIEYGITIVELVTKFTSILDLSIRLYKFNNFGEITSASCVQSIFTHLNDTQTIQTFQMFFSLYVSSPHYPIFFDGYNENNHLFSTIQQGNYSAIDHTNICFQKK
ncbi:hypothetical protein DLAC_11792 [Tieghemostelium lacteum]|uniref:Uncharacterized protein n=1 Tax=Tieghemostelium lacteum TaxID=361077 RepID=A0A151Z7E8_TIELA|nr:hypothetical protein DLAC_11792 [Tieghemostelium lacteum]|eukprot:KYQ89858.1 hypothetical protein DLAC_11792 [Tieghemostelium lacteum]